MCWLGSGFNLREALAEVKSLMDGGVASWEERSVGVHRHYQTLVREYKRTEKKLVECQKKQLEVCEGFGKRLLEV